MVIRLADFYTGPFARSARTLYPLNTQDGGFIRYYFNEEFIIYNKKKA